jgi:hypothetical protein
MLLLFDRLTGRGLEVGSAADAVYAIGSYNRSTGEVHVTGFPAFFIHCYSAAYSDLEALQDAAPTILHKISSRYTLYQPV